MGTVLSGGSSSQEWGVPVKRGQRASDSPSEQVLICGWEKELEDSPFGSACLGNQGVYLQLLKTQQSQREDLGMGGAAPCRVPC